MTPPTKTNSLNTPAPVKTSVGMETVEQTMARARSMVPSVKPQIAAADLATPPPMTTPPVPAMASIPPRVSSMVGNVTRDTEGFISAQSEAAKKRQELADEYGGLSGQGSMADLFSQQRKDLGIDDNLGELKDIQLQLTDKNTSSAVTKTQIESAAGQTQGQAQREVTQEDRENAVRTSGLAARAAVLQGNINTATQLARDTVDLAFKDRQLNAENLLNQLDYYGGIVDDQTKQLLEQDKRGYEAELATIKELKDNVASAMVSGASQAEISRLNDPTLPDADKLALAQSITARGATQERNLSMEAQRANIAQSYASIATSNTNRLLALAEAGDPSAIDGLGFDPRNVEEELDPTTKRQVEDKYQSTGSLLKLVTQYKDLIDKSGFTNQNFGDSETLGKVSALRGLITAEYKQAEQLGTLDAGLLTLMGSIIGTEPTSSIVGWGAEGNALTNLTGRKSSKLSAQLETVTTTLTNKQAEYALRLGINPTVLPSNDEDEIDAAYAVGGTNTTTSTSPFDPANAYK